MDPQHKAEEWINARKCTIKYLRELANELDNHTHKSRIAHVTGLSGSVAAGLITIGCLIAIPFTGGISFVGAAVAGGIGLGGGGLSIGTSVVRGRLEKGIISKVQEAIEEDRKLTESFMESLVLILKDPKSYISGSRNLIGAAKFAAQLADVADDAIRTVGTAARVSKILGIVGAALSVAILPFDIYDLVVTSKRIHHRSDSETATKIREIAEELEDKLIEITEAYNDSFLN